MLFQEPSTQFTMDTVKNELRFALENQCVDPANIPPKSPPLSTSSASPIYKTGY